jgi:hypothetical protein
MLLLSCFLFQVLLFTYYIWDTSQSQKNHFRLQARGYHQLSGTAYMLFTAAVFWSGYPPQHVSDVALAGYRKPQVREHVNLLHLTAAIDSLTGILQRPAARPC